MRFDDESFEVNIFSLYIIYVIAYVLTFLCLMYETDDRRKMLFVSWAEQKIYYLFKHLGTMFLTS